MARKGAVTLAPNEYCKTYTKMMGPAKMLHPNLCWPDSGGGVDRWLADDSDEAPVVIGELRPTVQQRV